jgi:hypothetical protein
MFDFAWIESLLNAMWALVLPWLMGFLTPWLGSLFG